MNRWILFLAGPAVLACSCAPPPPVLRRSFKPPLAHAGEAPRLIWLSAASYGTRDTTLTLTVRNEAPRQNGLDPQRSYLLVDGLAYRPKAWDHEPGSLAVTFALDRRLTSAALLVVVHDGGEYRVRVPGSPGTPKKQPADQSGTAP